MLGGHARQDNWIPPMISGFIRLFPSVRSSLCPPTQLLHYRDLHTATFVCSEPNLGMKRMKSANEDEELQDTQFLHTWAGFRTPVQLLLELLLPFTSISGPHTEHEDARAQTPTSLCTPSCSSLSQTLCTPKLRPASLLAPSLSRVYLAQPGSFAVHPLVSERSCEMVFAIS